jgi:hypothetical protein
MSPLAAYSFLPWLRQGIANTIAAQDNDASVKTRASIQVALELAGEAVGGGTALTQPLPQDIALYGPGDIVGIDSRAIFRTDPRPWITNYESNYLAAVEFYDEDFLWRYTPAAPDATGLRLRPWLTLIALQETEFSEGQGVVGSPLPSITVPDPEVFPPADELWAWAHVHFNQSVAGAPSELVSPDMGAVLPRVQSIIGQNPDLAYARLLCPRRLDDNTGYHAFVIPTFETGRLAGIGQDPKLAPHATYSAWDAAIRAGPTQPSCRSITAGTSGPARKATSNTWSRCSSRSRSIRRSARATWTSRTRARTLRASAIRRWAACCGWAARCAYPTPT